MAFETLISAYSLTPPNYPLLLSSFITFAFGYIEYVYSFLLVIHEHKAPYPLWMHTFYFAHDSTWCIRLFLAASEHDWNWFLTGTSAALLVWNGFEVFNLWMAVTVERQDIWGKKGSGREKGREEIGVKGPILDIIQQILGFYCVVNLFISFMGPDALFEWFLFTNVLIAWGPGTLWRTRQDRHGCSIGLALVIVIATINTFAPWSMWVLAMPERFGGVWFYGSGVVFTWIAVSNLMVVVGLKKKKW
ncbi:hypothetical protein BDZ45DRAFT_729437, partial [Acephala macrosclerotiorum]